MNILYNSCEELLDIEGHTMTFNLSFWSCCVLDSIALSNQSLIHRRDPETTSVCLKQSQLEAERRVVKWSRVETAIFI